MSRSRLYEPAAYGAAALDGCFWPGTQDDPCTYPALHGEAQADFAVIGAGVTGLSAALELARSGQDVAVLDRHRPGWGASGRNGGFCCLGGAKLGRDAMIRRYGEAEHRRYRTTEMAAIAHVRAVLDDHRIDADTHSQGGELQLAHRPRDWAAFQQEAGLAARDYGITPRLIPAADLPAEGAAGTGFHGGLVLPLGFALNPRKYVLGLAHAAQDHGARLHADSPVLRIARRRDSYVLATPYGHLRARRLLLATNGYSAEDLPDWMRGRYLPVQSSVIVTRPLTDAQIAAQGWSTDLMAFDSRSLLHYFRLLPDRRFLFGMRGGIAWTPRTHRAIRHRIIADFQAMFPAWRQVGMTHFWSGLACLTRSLVPFTGPIDTWPGAFAAFGYHGNGVAMGSFAGQQMARLAMDQTADLPGFFARPPPRFEGGGLRRHLLRAAYAWYAWRDR